MVFYITFAAPTSILLLPTSQFLSKLPRCSLTTAMPGTRGPAPGSLCSPGPARLLLLLPLARRIRIPFAPSAFSFRVLLSDKSLLSGFPINSPINK